MYGFLGDTSPCLNQNSNSSHGNHTFYYTGTLGPFGITIYGLCQVHLAPSEGSFEGFQKRCYNIVV